MKILLIVAHPNKNSLNHGFAEEIIKELETRAHQVKVHDLYAEGFDPLLAQEELKDDFVPRGLLADHCRELTQCNGLVIIHPNWRDQPPAILKGWLDRVIRVGVAFRYEGNEGEEGHPVGLLNTETALIINTSDCPQAVEESLGDPLQTLWEDCVLKPCGVKKVVRRNFTEVILSSEQDRTAWLAEAARLSGEIFSTSPGT